MLAKLSPLQCRVILALVLLAGFASRVAYLTINPPIGLSGDEAHYWDWSRQLDWSYYSKGPAVANVIRFGCWLFGDTMFGVRFPALLLAIGTSLCTYWLTRRMFRSDRLALGAVLLCHLVPMFVAGSLLMTIDPPYYFCWAMATCFGYLAVVEGKRWAWIAAGAFVGLGFLAKYAALLWFVCLLVLLIARRHPRRWLATPWPYLSLLVALLFTAPVIIWNVQHDWVTFGHVARSTTENQSGFNPLNILANFGNMVGSQIGILNPVIAGFMVAGVVLAFRSLLRREKAGVRGPAIIENDSAAAGPPHPNPLPKGEGTALALAYLLALSVPFFAIVAIVTVFKEIEPNWPAPTYFTLVPLAAWFVAHTWPKVKGWFVAACVIGLIALPVSHFTTLLYPIVPASPRKWDPSFRMHGYQEIGQRVGELLKTLPGEPFVLCDRYQMTGLMAFYVPGQPKTYCIGSYIADPKERDRLSQYDMWPDRSLDQPSLLGRNAVFVGHEQPDLFRAFERVEELPRLPVVRNGVQIREQKLWLCYNFRGLSRPNDGLTKR